MKKETNYENVVRKYADMVLRISMNIMRNEEDAKELFQDVFLKLYEKNIEFDTEEHQKAWLIRVTINLGKNLLKRKKYRTTEELNNIPNIEHEDNYVYYEVLKLPLKYKTVIHLYYYEGYKIKEISSILHTNESTVKTRLARGKAILKIRLGGDFDE